MKKRTTAFRHVLSHFYGTPWAIRAEKLAELRAVLWRRIEANPRATDAEFVQLEQIGAASEEVLSSSLLSPSKVPLAFEDSEDLPQQQSGTSPGYKLVGSVAVIRINGTISPRPSLFDEWSGGTSHEAIGRATEAALADGKAEHILYDIDSPGGMVFGIPENADKVRAAKKTKPTTAIANHCAASAAYWYMAQAGELIVTPAGMVGSIGVLMNTVDETEALKMKGIRDVLVNNTDSPYKSEGYPQVPFTEEQRADMQRQCDAYGEMFVAAIAKGRGLQAKKVKADFGRGRMLMAEEAVAVRMVDKIGTLQETVDAINGAKSKAAKRRVAAELVKLRLPTA